MKYPNSFSKSARLLKRHQYHRMAYHSKRHVGCLIIIEISPNQSSSTRLGITVSRKFGKAHQRNRFKRIVREAFRHCLIQLPQGIDLNVKPRSHAAEANSLDILNEMVYLVNYASRIKSTSETGC